MHALYPATHSSLFLLPPPSPPLSSLSTHNYAGIGILGSIGILVLLVVSWWLMGRASMRTDSSILPSKVMGF